MRPILAEKKSGRERGNPEGKRVSGAIVKIARARSKVKVKTNRASKGVLTTTQALKAEHLPWAIPSKAPRYAQFVFQLVFNRTYNSPMTNLDTIFSAKVAKSISNSQELGFFRRTTASFENLFRASGVT